MLVLWDVTTGQQLYRYGESLPRLAPAQPGGHQQPPPPAAAAEAGLGHSADGGPVGDLRDRLGDIAAEDFALVEGRWDSRGEQLFVTDTAGGFTLLSTGAPPRLPNAPRRPAPPPPPPANAPALGADGQPMLLPLPLPRPLPRRDAAATGWAR